MDGELFLQWLSFRGYGSLTDVTSSVAALVEGPAHTKINLSRTYLRRLEVLGHLDLSWADSKWRIQPTVITQLPGSSALALVIGNRTPGLEERLEEDAELLKIEPTNHGTVTLGDPKTLIFEYDSESDLAEVATKAGATFISCAASSMATNLPVLGPGPRAAGPNNYGSPVDIFNTSAQEFTHVETFRRDGLFRQMINGRFQYWLFKSGTWFLTNYAEGKCLVMSEKDTRYLQLKVHKDLDNPVGTLSIDFALSLPVEHRRALVLCSGVSPIKASDGAWIYENVPTSVASAVARSIHQHLQVR